MILRWIVLGSLVGCGSRSHGFHPVPSHKVAVPTRAPADESLPSWQPTGTPEIVLVESNPWAMVIGSDSPSLALYSDGSFIYRADKPADPARPYRIGRLSDADRDGLIVEARTDLALRKDSYEGSRATDQPSVTLALFDAGKRHAVSVYGSPTDAEVRDTVPKPFIQLYDRLAAVSPPKVAVWLPERIEVMLWPFENAKGEGVAWPKDWPGLDSPDAVKRGGDGLTSVYLPVADYDALRALLYSAKDKGAILVGEKKMAGSVRLPFPGL